MYKYYFLAICTLSISAQYSPKVNHDCAKGTVWCGALGQCVTPSKMEELEGMINPANPKEPNEGSYHGGPGQKKTEPDDEKKAESEEDKKKAETADDQKKDDEICCDDGYDFCEATQKCYQEGKESCASGPATPAGIKKDAKAPGDVAAHDKGGLINSGEKETPGDDAKKNAPTGGDHAGTGGDNSGAGNNEDKDAPPGTLPGDNPGEICCDDGYDFCEDTQQCYKTGEATCSSGPAKPIGDDAGTNPGAGDAKAPGENAGNDVDNKNAKKEPCDEKGENPPDYGHPKATAGGAPKTGYEDTSVGEDSGAVTKAVSIISVFAAVLSVLM